MEKEDREAKFSAEELEELFPAEMEGYEDGFPCGGTVSVPWALKACRENQPVTILRDDAMDYGYWEVDSTQRLRMAIVRKCKKATIEEDDVG